MAMQMWGTEKHSNFSGTQFDVYSIEGQHVVLKITKDLVTPEMLGDTETFSTILAIADGYYEAYLQNVGVAPSGGDPAHGFKSSIFFGSPSCGAACGLVGSKGVEVGGTMLKEIYNELRFGIKRNRIGIIAYEFGRNFSVDAGKFLSPTGPSASRNGGWAEAFAGYLGIWADLNNPNNQLDRDINETALNPKWNRQIFYSYINDTLATPLNSFYNWTYPLPTDPARGWNGSSAEYNTYPSSGAFQGIVDVVGHDALFPAMLQELRLLPNATDEVSSMSNIALAVARASGTDWSSFFANVLKFNLSSEAMSEMAGLPKPKSHLLDDLESLWFISVRDSLRINLRSTQYLADNCTYQLVLNGEVYSESKHGNNTVDYSVFDGGQSVVNAEAKLLCADSGVSDSRLFKIQKRHNVSLTSGLFDWYVYAPAKYRSLLEDGVFQFENLDSFFEWGGVETNFMMREGSQGRIEASVSLQLTTHLDTLASGTPQMTIVGASIAGSDGIAVPTTTNTSIAVQSNFSAPTIPVSSGIPNNVGLLLGKLRIDLTGVELATVENMTFRDMTDSDGDGIVDFEDPSPLPRASGVAKELIELPEKFELHPVYPNPFNPTTTISFGLPASSSIRISVVDILGRRVASIVSGEVKAAGYYTVQFNADGLSSGTYLIRMEAGGFVETRLITLLK